MLFSFKVKCSKGKCLTSKLLFVMLSSCSFADFKCFTIPTISFSRDHYVKEGNLFAYDVKADKDMHDRDNFIDKISPALDV